MSLFFDFQMAISSSQPTATPSSPSNDDAVVVDRFSDLSDCILCHILSFLPTTNAVETSILSKRWKSLWTFVPSLNLDVKNRKVHPITFLNIVSKVFSLHKAPYIKFHLSLISPYNNPFHVDTLVNAAISPNLEDFFLCIRRDAFDDADDELYRWKLFELPRSIFSCKNLVVLELTGPINLNLNLNPCSVWFPRLKVLRLNLITNKESDWRLLSAGCCPVLEDLYLGRSAFLTKDTEVVKFKICLPKLKRLSILFVMFYVLGRDYEFEINAPALEYFDIEGDLGNIVFLEKPSNLVGATVNIFSYENSEEKGDYGDRVLGLVRQLYNVQNLKLYSATTEWLYHAHGNYINLPMFHKLVRLDFEVECCYWGVLPHFLDHAPNLQVLDLYKHYCFPFIHSHQSCLVEQGSVSPRLTTFYFRGFEGFEDQLTVVRYILNNARVLKTMTLAALGNLRDFEEEKSHILDELSTYPKLSMSCQIAFV